MNTLFAILVAASAFLFPIWNTANMVLTEARLSVNVYQPIQTAAKLQAPSDMVEYFEQAEQYLVDHNIDNGNTCVVFSSQPNCNLNLFYRKISQDIEILNEIKGEPLASIETTNALTRIHQSLFSNQDDTLLTPDHSFWYRWYGWPIWIAKLIDWFSGLLVLLGLLIILGIT